MEIIVGKTAGFCFGVKNAVDKTLEELEKDKKVFCLGELVHNTQVTEELEEKGAKFINNIDEAKNKVIIRAHGIPKEIYKKAENLKLKLIDLTCPNVLNIHKIAEEYANKNYFIIITGQAEHPETIGTASFCNDKYYVIENESSTEDAILEFEKSKSNNLVIISQTTYSVEKFNNIVEKIKEKIPENTIEIKNTICMATQKRQEETIELSKQVDAMIIIGGKHSSNVNKLLDLATKYCKTTYFIETQDELDVEKIKDLNKIGIMAGASTPYGSIKKTIEKIEKMC